MKSVVGAISEKRKSTVDEKKAANTNGETPADSDNNSIGSSNSDSSFSSGYSDSSNSFDLEKLDNKSSLPQSQAQKKRTKYANRTQLARSLVGELVVTPSCSRLLIEDSSDDEDDVGSKSKIDSSDDDRGTRQNSSSKQRQYTISKKKKKVRVSVSFESFIYDIHLNHTIIFAKNLPQPYGVCTYPITVFSHMLGLELGKDLQEDVEGHLYRPSKTLYRYISWTFYSNFLEVFFSFLVIFIVLCVIFALFLFSAGNKNPECIVISGEMFGAQPYTKFYDAFALSWTTFTTVG